MQLARLLEWTHLPMDVKTVSLPTLTQLRDHVHIMLCMHDRIDPVQTSLQQALILRSGKPCGVFFHIRGPRHLKNHAVWAREEDRILFYDSSGLRFAETRLCTGPDLADIAA
jgi:hypothetical protein